MPLDPHNGTAISRRIARIYIVVSVFSMKIVFIHDSALHSSEEGASERAFLPQIEMLAFLLNNLLQPLNLFIVFQTVDSVNVPSDQIHERLQKRCEFAGILGFNQ